MAVTWLRLEARRRWRSLVVVALLVALTTGTVLAAVAGARRGQSAWDRLWAQTLPATVTVVPNQPGFDWTKIEALPEVAATAKFLVLDGELITGNGSAGSFSSTNLGFPAGDTGNLHTVERPVVLAGRMSDSGRADEVVASAEFMSDHHLQVGAPLTVHLPTPAQAEKSFDPTNGQPPRGPLVQVRIVGVVRSPFWIDGPGSGGGVLPTYAFTQKYSPYLLGNDPAHTSVYINALMRLKGGEAAIPAFKADLARMTGRSDIDVWDNYQKFGGPVLKGTSYEAAVLLAFGVSALLAALFLVGQTVARYAADTAEDLRVLQAMGLTRRKAAACAGAVLGLTAAAGAFIGVAAALITSRWMPIGLASYAEPHPGFDADWLVLIPGWAIAVLLVAGGTALLTWSALSPRRTSAAPRGSAVARAAVAAGLPVAAVMGTRFALEPGRGRAAVPVLPAIMGAVAGVLGVLAAFTFSAGVSDAAVHPERFGVTWQLEAFYGLDGQDGGRRQVSRAVAASPDVAGLLDMRVGGAQASGVSIESFEYNPVGGKRVPVVLTAGTLPAEPGRHHTRPDHRAAAARRGGNGAPAHRRSRAARDDRHRHRLRPRRPAQQLRPGRLADPGRVQPAVRRRALQVQVPPGRRHPAAGRRPRHRDEGGQRRRRHGHGRTESPVRAAATGRHGGDPAGPFSAADGAGRVPGAARRRRRRLRAHHRGAPPRPRTGGAPRPRPTGRQARLVVVTQATVLAVAGIAAGIPLGLIIARAVWRAVANFVPLAYQPPLAPWALILIAPATLLAANVLAVWPGWRAARLRPGQVLHAE